MMEWANRYGADLIQATITHLYYVLIPVALGFVIAVILGVLLSRVPKISGYILPVLSVFQTIPGIVFVGILFLYVGMVPATVLIALTIYAVFPILKNTYVGLLNVDEKVKEAARGCGMSPLQILIKIELPLAMPNIFVGLRLIALCAALFAIVSWAVLAAMIGLGGLGDFIYRGVGTNNNMLILTGAIPAAILALSLGALVDWIQKRLTPRGLGGKRG